MLTRLPCQTKRAVQISIPPTSNCNCKSLPRSAWASRVLFTRLRGRRPSQVQARGQAGGPAGSEPTRRSCQLRCSRCLCLLLLVPAWPAPTIQHKLQLPQGHDLHCRRRFHGPTCLSRCCAVARCMRGAGAAAAGGQVGEDLLPLPPEAAALDNVQVALAGYLQAGERDGWCVPTGCRDAVKRA